MVKDKKVFTGFRLDRKHQIIIRKFARKDRISESEVVRRAIEHLAATNL